MNDNKILIKYLEDLIKDIKEEKCFVQDFIKEYTETVTIEHGQLSRTETGADITIRYFGGRNG